MDGHGGKSLVASCKRESSSWLPVERHRAYSKNMSLIIARGLLPGFLLPSILSFLLSLLQNIVNEFHARPWLSPPVPRCRHTPLPTDPATQTCFTPIVKYVECISESSSNMRDQRVKARTRDLFDKNPHGGTFRGMRFGERAQPLGAQPVEHQW